MLYVARVADRELFDTLVAGELAYVLAPRQIGKSSLMLRTQVHLGKVGVRSAVVDLSLLATPDATAETLYFGIIDEVSRHLNLGDVLPWWQKQGDRSPVHRMVAWIREALGAGAIGPVVVFFDEVDATKSLTFSRDDFFAALRVLYNERSADPTAFRVTFCLLGVASPADLMSDPRRTPFNIGRNIRIEDFRPEEAETILPALASLPHPEAALAAILHWTSGHPYMTLRLASELVIRGSDNVDQVAREAFLLTGRREETSLSYAELRFDQYDPAAPRSAMLDLYERLLVGPIPAVGGDPVQVELRLSGIAAEALNLQGERVLRVRNRIYATVFDTKWVQEKQRDRYVHEALRAWVRGGKLDDLLLRGAALAAAEEWASGQVRLSEDQRAFFIRSRELAVEEQRRARETSRLREEAEVRERELASSRTRTRLLSGAVVALRGVVLALLSVGGVGILLILVVAAVAIPNFIQMQLKSKRAELPGNVDGIKIAELAHDAAYDTFVACGNREAAEAVVGKNLRDFATDPAAPCFTETLSWAPDGQIRGAYWVEVTQRPDGRQDFIVHGVADVDGDGELAHYTATSSINATLALGQENVY